MSPIAGVFVFVHGRLRVAVGAEQAQIFPSVVVGAPVDVVEFQRNGKPVLNVERTLGVAVWFGAQQKLAPCYGRSLAGRNFSVSLVMQLVAVGAVGVAGPCANRSAVGADITRFPGGGHSVI